MDWMQPGSSMRAVQASRQTSTMAVQESKETAGSPAFVGAALLFAAATLFYSIKDSLRGFIVTDIVQAAIFVVFLVTVLPAPDAAPYRRSSLAKLTLADTMLWPC